MSSSASCTSCGAPIDEFGRALPPPAPDGWRNPALTVDACVVREGRGGGGLEVLLIRRGIEPFKGYLALPGGFVDYNEDPRDAVLRELREETGLVGRNPRVVTVRGDPRRDPRKHVVALVYLVEVDAAAVPVGGARCLLPAPAPPPPTAGRQGTTPPPPLSTTCSGSAPRSTPRGPLLSPPAASEAAGPPGAQVLAQGEQLAADHGEVLCELASFLDLPAPLI